MIDRSTLAEPFQTHEIEGATRFLAQPSRELVRGDAKAAGGLTIRLFGGMTMEDARGTSFLPRSRKTRGLVAILALTAPKPVLRQRLTGLLWSQREREQGRASLRQAVHELQEALTPAWNRILIAERHQLSMDPRGVTVDARRAAEPGAPRTDLLDLFQEGFLEDLSGLDSAFDEWLGIERRRLLSIARLAGESLIEDPGTPVEMRAAARALLRIDPTHDEAWQALIQANIDLDDRSAAQLACRQWREAMDLPATAPPPPGMAALLARLHGTAVPPPVAPATGEVREESSGRGLLEPRRGHRAETAADRPDESFRRASLRIGIREMHPIGSGVEPSLAPGVAEELTTALSRFRWISCVPASTLTGLMGDRTSVWPALDLCLDGTIQGGGGRLRITARLLDMRAGGEVIWANRFDRETNDLLALQEGVAAGIVAQLEPLLLIREGERATRNRHAASPRELVLKAVPAIYRLERQSFRAAGALLETALRANPSFTEALAWYAYWHLFLVGQGWSEEPEAAIERAGHLADSAVASDPNDARSLTLAGHVRGFLMKRASEAMVLHDRAIALNPNLALAWCFSGLALSYLGDHREAMDRLRQAIALSPSDPHLFFFQSAVVVAQFQSGDYEAAAASGREAVELNPWFSATFKAYLAALGQLGRGREAVEIRARLLKLEPAFTVRDAIRRSPLVLPGDLGRWAEGLRKAGLPE